MESKNTTWQQDFRDSVRTVEELAEYLGRSPESMVSLNETVQRFPMRITKYYLSLIDREDPEDPIARMCIPSTEELAPGGSFDTSGELDNTIEGGIQHKYRATALILSSNVCSMYCRYCFRKRLVGLSDSELNKQVDDARDYIGSHPEITNVLISGGDSLMNPTHIIARYLEELCSIDTLDFIRFGTRTPVTFPQRIYKDPELLDLFEEYARKKPIYFSTQFNHPRELTEEALLSIHLLQERGIQVRNQTVLLRGVNDDAETMNQLLEQLVQSKIIPYYIFQCRPVTGVKGHFQVPLAEGVRIVDRAKNMQSGLGKSVHFCMSHPLGKIEILGKNTDGEMTFKFHQSKYPENESRIFTAPLTDQDTWLDENLLGI